MSALPKINELSATKVWEIVKAARKVYKNTGDAADPAIEKAEKYINAKGNWEVLFDHPDLRRGSTGHYYILLDPNDAKDKRVTKTYVL